MAVPNINTFTKVIPMIYAYNTPEIARHDGWTKIGYTEKQTVEDRIKQQTRTADVRWSLAWKRNAMFQDGSGEYFTDHDFHKFLEVEKSVQREKGSEWFQIDGKTSKEYFEYFADRDYSYGDDERTPYILRSEQVDAINKTRAYFDSGGKEFLWNAKPRFGKTLTAYNLILKMDFKKVLIVTNRPSIANSWSDDFMKFIAWQGKFAFVSETDSLKKHPGVLTREEYNSTELAGKKSPKGMIAFESLQGLKGSVYFGGQFDKLKWIKDNVFDLLIIDESHEGVDTMLTERAFNNINRKHTLYLSGTPFKQLASDVFTEAQIYNWSYANEQESKGTYKDEPFNPYESLPRLNMYTYQLSSMIYDEISKGIDLEEDGTSDYAFDLNEFFATNESGKFIYEEDIKKFLHALTTQEKYPYSTPELREELSHTMWLLNRVASAKALARLISEDPVFREYEVVLAAGDGRLDEEHEAADAYNRVKNAIAGNNKTITLSVGQLTVGITIPEWSGVLMLCNLNSPSSYMQAAFRAQNPYSFTKEGVRMRKENAYVFDFDPARTLIIFDEFANNLSKSTVDGNGTRQERENNIKKLLNFFPVLAEDGEGEMVELDAERVLSIPRKIKSMEVVKRGFMSNFLFQNINNIFGAPSVVRDIVEKLTPAHEEVQKRDKKILDDIPTVDVDDCGEVVVDNEVIIGKAQDLFGDKIYEEALTNLAPIIESMEKDVVPEEVSNTMDKLCDNLKSQFDDTIIDTIATGYNMKSTAKKRIENELHKEIDNSLTMIENDYSQRVNIAKVEYDNSIKNASNDTDASRAGDQFEAERNEALQDLIRKSQELTNEIIENKPKEVIEKIERNKKESEKRVIENTIRDHLRGFSRTIPSFIMAYGDDRITLANFDEYTEDEVFEKVTGITEANFRFLRDGGGYIEEETGETKHFEGNLFDEVVFNDSVNEFWNKKIELANYFDESHDEDIFDYIPPQKTNQIFTPRWVVTKMVNELEENNPGCFDNPNNTFADLYMKSGLYITEIVKCLYRSDGLKKAFPNGDERIRHILRNQVYGMAPSRIIYLIATNYILGFDESLRNEIKNFVECDAAEVSKKGLLQEEVDKYFGE